MLERSCPDYRGLLINLYEPIAVNALGLALLGNSPRSLVISLPQRLQLEARFANLPATERNNILTAGALTLCDALGIRSNPMHRYVQATVLALGSRLSAAVTLEHIFLTL